MVEIHKIDKKYLKISGRVKDLDVDDSGFYPPSAIRVDIHRHCWVDQRAERLEGVAPGSSEPLHEWVHLTRVKDGVRVVFAKNYKDYKWETGLKPTPEESEGYEWLPVVEIAEAPKNRPL